MRVPLNRRVQPPLDYQFALNSNSQQARGLVGWWPPIAAHGKNGLVDLAHGAAGTVFDTGNSWAVEAAGGNVVNYDASANCRMATNITYNNSAYSYAVWANPFTAVNNNSKYVCFENTSDRRNIGLIQRTSVYYWWSFAGAETPESGTAASVLTTLHTWSHVVLTHDGVTQNIYLNGVLGKSVTNTPGAADAFYIGGYGGATTVNFSGNIGDLRVYDRVLLADEVWQLWAPQTRWELYAPPALLRFWSVPAGTITGPTVVADYSLFPKANMRRGAHL